VVGGAFGPHPPDVGKAVVEENVNPVAPTESAEPSVARIPNSVILRRALVARWEYERLQIPMDLLAAELGNETTDGVRRHANLAAKLSSKSCFFCGLTRGKKLLKEIDWTTFELCGCLAELRRDEVWHIPKPGPQELLHILHGVNARTLSDADPVMTRTCPAYHVDGDGNRIRCEKRWTLRAGSLAHAVRSFLLLQADRDAEEGVTREPVARLQDFQWQRKCRSCKTAARRELGRDEGSVPEDNSAPLLRGEVA